jgi:RHS repeat-associated protein
MPTIDAAINLESRTSTASVPIPGTDLTLNYFSDRVRGTSTNPSRSVSVPLTGSNPPDSLKRVDLTIEVAGQRNEFEFSPDPDRTESFTWDGRDGFGNRVQGPHTATIEITYVYDGVYSEPDVDRGSAFNNRPGVEITGSEAREELYFTTDYEVDLQYFDAARTGLGGWWLSPHHVRNRNRSSFSLLQGDGTDRTIKEDSLREVDQVPAGRFDILDTDEYFATSAVAPDGSLTVTLTGVDYGSGADSDEIAAVRVYDLPSDGFEQLLASDGDSIDVVGTLIADEGSLGADGYVFDVAYGSEGRLYLAELVGGMDPIFDSDSTNDGRVRRISEDGSTVTTLAGTTDGQHPTDEYGSFGDWIADVEGSLATDVPLPAITSVVVGSDGDTYLKLGPMNDEWGGGVVRLSPDGRLYRAYSFDLVGGDTFDGIPVLRDTIAVGPSGDLYVGEPGRIVRIDSQGNVRVLAGSGSGFEQVRQSDDSEHLLAAKEAKIGTVLGLHVDETGTVYFMDRAADADSSSDREDLVRKFDPGGLVTRIMGTGDRPIRSDTTYRGAPADTAYRFFGQWPLLWTDAGDIHFMARERATDGSVFARLRQAFDIDRIPSRDGSKLYEFVDGRHARTVDTLTGTTLYEFAYDDAGRLTSVTDRNGSVVQVERDADGAPTAIVAPTGQRLELALTDGYVTGITRPDDRQLGFTYTGGGLLERITHPGGDETTFQYDGSGRVTGRTRPTGGQDDLVQQAIENGRRLTHLTPEMRETTVDVERTAAGRRITTQCCNTAGTETLISPDGEWTTTYPDGASKTTRSGLDPRFGGRSPLPASVTYTSPGGTTTTTEFSRSVTLSDETDPLSLTAFSETSTVNGRSYERSYDPGAGEWTVTTPGGRTMTVGLDAGRTSTVSPTGTDGLSMSYDADGRVTGVGRTGNELALEYDGGGNLSAVTDAEGRRSEMTLSDGEYPESFTSPLGNTTAFSYDADGYLSSMTRPNGETHDYEFDAAGHMTGYTPPEGGSRTISHDADGFPTEVALPSGRTITNEFDASTRLQQASHPDATVTYQRDELKRLTGLTRSPADGSTDQSLSITRDGKVTTELAFSGPASGTFQYAHDADGQVSQITHPNGSTRALSRDDDGLLTGEGPFTVERNGPMGRPSRISDFTGVVEYTYDQQGRVASRSHTVDGTEFYSVEYTYDQSDLLVERTETLPNGQRTEAFTYDADGRLTEVQRDGSVVESYAYDENGNRTERTVDGTTEQASYDPGDRLVEQGSRTYGYDADGHVTDRNGDTLDYSATGELLSATLSGGSSVEYTSDGYGRRVARTAPDGTTTEYLYGDPNAPTRVTAVRESGEWTHYYYDLDGRLYAFERGGSWYYVATDQVGTPRVVVDSSGSVVREIDRDAYGAVRSDSDPAFPLHVGFAGGIPDPETGLVRFGMRDYDPETGRWLARDPMLLAGGQFNFYSYVENDPVNAVDPTGLSWDCFIEKMLENFDKTEEYTDLIGKILDELGVDTGADLKLKELFKAGLENYLEELAKGKAKKAAAKAAGKSLLKSASRGGLYNLALYGGMLVGSGIYAGIDQYFGQGPGEALFELINGPNESLSPCEARERGLIDEDCPEKALEDCC